MIKSQMDHGYIEKHDVVRRYGTGRLLVEDVERFEAHYLECAGCQRQLEEFEILRQGLTDLAAESAGKGDVERGTAWRRAGLAMAAVLAGLAVLPVWMLSREDVPAPAANALILPVTQLRAAGSAPQAAIRPAPDAPFLLMLELDWPEFDAYAVRILDADGVSRWQGESLQPNYLDALTVSIPPGFLPPGVYRAEVHAQTPDGPRPVGDFPFQILPPE